MEDQIKKLLESQMKGKSPEQIKKLVPIIIIVAIIGGLAWGFVSGALNSFLGQKGLKLESGTLSIDQDKIWPLSMPTEVPLINQGKVMSTFEDKVKNLWNVSFTDLPEEIGKNYKTRLEEKGWTITRDTFNEESNALMVYAEYDLELGYYLLNYTHNFDSKYAQLIVEKKFDK